MDVASFNEIEAPDGGRRLAVSGPLTILHLREIVDPLRAIAPAGSRLDIDLAGLETIDTSGAWLIHRLQRDWTAAGVPAEIVNASPDAQRLIAEVSANDVPCPVRPAHGNPVVARLARIGEAMIHIAANIGNFLAFFGQTLVIMGETITGKRPLRWNAFIHQCEAIPMS